MAIELSPPPTEYKCKATDHLINPVIEDAAEALLRQNRRVQTINLERPAVHEGLMLLPNWEGFSITRLEQRRDTRDLRIRGKSAHDVSFGLADLRTPQGLQVIAIAVKPFDEDYKAVQDAVSNAHVLKRGFSTTDPICVVIDQGKGFIITPVKEGVQPLDTEPWHEFQTTTNPEVIKHFKERLNLVGIGLADLTFRGIIHADSQLRNWWMTPEGILEPFDWESAVIYPDPPTPKNLLDTSIRCLRPLYGNLAWDNRDTLGNLLPSIFKGPSSQRWNYFKEYVLTPFTRRMDELMIESGRLDDDNLEAVSSIETALKGKLGSKLS